MEYLLLLLGFALLIISGRLLITGSVSIARKLRLSSFVIGLTVVAVGTSAPELLVSLTGAVKGHADVAVYNVIGSNISNVLLVLALAAVILPIPVARRTLWFDGSVMLAFSLAACLFMLDLRFSPPEGGLLLLLTVVYVAGSIYRSRKQNEGTNRMDVPGMKTWMAVLGVVAASVGLALGADMLVENAVQIAVKMGLSQRVISVSMIAVGTSIPELTTSLIAAFRKETEISIGNIMGSNIFNVGFVLGVTTSIKPLELNAMVLSFDVFWFAGASLLLIVLVLLPRRLELSRWKGLAMLSLYLIYLYLILKDSPV